MPKTTFSPAALVARGALMTYLAPRLAQDSKIDLGPTLTGLTAKNFASKKPFLIGAIRSITAGNLAKDAELDDLPDMLDQIESLASEASEAIDPAGAATSGNEGGAAGGGNEGQDDDLSDLVAMIQALSPEDRARLDEMITHKVEPDPSAAAPASPDQAVWDTRAADARAKLGRDETEEEAKKRMEAMDARRSGRAHDTKLTKAAMDAAIAAAVGPAVEAAVTATTRRELATREAIEVARPYIGRSNLAFDSAEKVYRNALKLLGVVGHDTIHESALKTVLEMQTKPGAGRARLATDAAAPSSSFAKRFPNASRVEVM